MNSDIFLCYRSRGAQTAKLFKRYMSKKGIDGVWYSDDEVYGNYKSDIPDLIQNAQSVILFVTCDFFDGFIEKPDDNYECITLLEVIEIEKRLQKNDGLRLITVFIDRDGFTLHEQELLKTVFNYASMLTASSINHFSQSNIIKFDTRKGYEEDLFEQLSDAVLPDSFYEQRILGNFSFLGNKTNVDIIQQDINKSICIKFSEYRNEPEFYKKVKRLNSEVYNEIQNDEMISVVRCECTRESNNENLEINIIYRTIEYRFFHKCLQLFDNERLKIKKKLFEYNCDCDELYDIPNAMGLAIMVITSDGYLVFTQRSKQRRIRSGEYDCSIVEGLKIDVHDNVNGTYDVFDDDYVYRECQRAYREEISYLASNLDIKINGIILDKKYGQWNIVGTIFTDRTKDQLQQEHPFREDTYEKNQLTFVRIDKNEIIEKVKKFRQIGLWDTALATLQLTLLRLKLDFDD